MIHIIGIRISHTDLCKSLEKSHPEYYRLLLELSKNIYPEDTQIANLDLRHVGVLEKMGLDFLEAKDVFRTEDFSDYYGDEVIYYFGTKTIEKSDPKYIRTIFEDCKLMLEEIKKNLQPVCELFIDSYAILAPF